MSVVWTVDTIAFVLPQLGLYILPFVTTTTTRYRYPLEFLAPLRDACAALICACITLLSSRHRESRAPLGRYKIERVTSTAGFLKFGADTSQL